MMLMRIARRFKHAFPIFFEGNYGREPLHVYLMASPIALLGATPVAIRIVPALQEYWL